MDPYESICSKCQITSSAEEILNEAIAAAKSEIAESSKRTFPAEDDLRILHRSAKTLLPDNSKTLFMDPYESICRECQITSSAEEILNEAITAAKSGISESSKRKSPAEDDLRIPHGSAKTSCNDVYTIADSGISNTNVKEFGASKNLSEYDLSFFERMKFHAAKSKLPDLLSLKDSGVLSERELGYFVRIEELISKGALPNIRFRNLKGDSPMSPNKRNFSKSCAPDASSNLDVEEFGNDGAGLGFSKMGTEKRQISKTLVMDPYESICRECQITSSAEEILNEAIAAVKSEISESSKRTSPAEEYSRIPQRSAKKSCNDVDTTADLGISNTNLKEFGASKNLSEFDLGLFERMKFHAAGSKLPDLPSLKDSGVLSERELGYFVRIQELISKGVLPNIRFQNLKGDSSVSPNKGNFGKSSAPDASCNLDAEDFGNDGADLGFSKRGTDKHRILKEKSRANLESPKCTVDFSTKFTAKASEMNIQRSAGPVPESPRTVHMKESCVAQGNSPLETDPGLSKSKGDSSGETLKKSIALDTSLPLPYKSGTSISKNRSLLEENSISGIRSFSGSILRSEKDGIKDPAHEDPVSGGRVEEDVGLKRSRHYEDTGPTDEFARFRYCKSGNPPNFLRSIQDSTSHNRGIGRKLPPSILDPIMEKMDVSNRGARGGDVPSLQASLGVKVGVSGSTKSSNSALRDGVMEILLDMMKAGTKESDRCSGDEDEDILKVAEKAGYTFPSPRWWPP